MASWRSEPDPIRRSFLHFSEMCAEAAPLYAALSRRVADEPRLLDLAQRSPKGQPAPNMLFGAVHFLLLGGVDHPLASFYPSLGGDSPAAAAWPAFIDFCREHERAIGELIGTRRVQTNVVGRCGLLLPAFGIVTDAAPAPLHIIEIGASAGLNMLFDRFRYEYSDGQSCGSAESPVRMTVEVRGDVPAPVPHAMPQVASRIGIDLDPVDVTDPDAMRWVEAMIWPDEVDRVRLHRAAVAVAQADPPRIVEGDALDLLPQVVNNTPAHRCPVIFHSTAIYQMNRAWRERFSDAVDAIGRDRDLAHISLEWLDPDPCHQLRLTMFINGGRAEAHLASCHHHGRWIEWLA